MNILYVTPYPPYPPESGGKIRSYNLIREIARHHHVTLFTLADATDQKAMEEHLSRFLAAVEVYPVIRPGWFRRKTRPDLFRHFHSPPLRKRLKLVLARPGVDLIHVEELCLSDMLPRTRVPRVLGRQKVDTFFYRSVYEADGRLKKFRWQSDLVKLVQQEKRARRRFQGHVLCSRLDATRLATLIGRYNHRVVPNGVDLDYFAPQAAPQAAPRAGAEPGTAGQKRTLVFTGSMDYEPNVDGARYFVQEIWPAIRAHAPDVETLFVGHRPTEEVKALGNTPGITITGSVPDVRPFIRDATAVVVPIRIGEGTRLKILEAMAMKRPVVSTRPGAEGLQVKDGEHISLATDAADFADRTVRLLDAPDEADRLAEGGYRTVQDHYGWEAIGRQLAIYYREIVESASS